jgi:hypothetical protein
MELVYLTSKTEQKVGKTQRQTWDCRTLLQRTEQKVSKNHGARMKLVYLGTEQKVGKNQSLNETGAPYFRKQNRR